jgi:hypothetical protein
MLTSKERRDLEAYWTEGRILRAAALLKASMALAALVGLLWIGFAMDTPEAWKSQVTAASRGTLRADSSGSAARRAREVFEERRARWSEMDALSPGDIARHDP